ncbi:MAG: AI-2E family transporter [Deltaproteobacteria bacterium]|jgi:predicted PurR-regulated permease PerM|nr:AI-2E family transporter [Deltaproteobacteria bacterium]
MPSTEDRAFIKRALETSIRVGLTLFLVVWCFEIARPFLQPIVWGIILAIATQPIYAALCRAMGGRRSLAAAILVVGALLILIVPSVLLTANVAESTTKLAKNVEAGTLEVPPPPAGVADWPVVGGRVHAFWTAASRNLDTALDPLHPQLKAVGGWVLGTATSAGLGLLVFALSIVLAGVLLASGEPAADAAREVAERLVPDRGAELVALARDTVQSVTRGILGTAFIQAFLAGIGMLAAGVPAFGLWALLVLFLAVVQLPPLLVLAPIIVWVFASSSTGVAITFAIWATAVGLSDNVLKPLLLGRGADVPMFVIFIGAIGGFIRAGIIGLFVGAVVLAVGHNLFKWWLKEAQEDQ